MGFLLGDFVLDTGACIRYPGSAHVQYPARPANQYSSCDVWPYLCTWIVMPIDSDADIKSRIQALISSSAQTTLITVLAVHSDGSSDCWTTSVAWPEAVTIIESVESRCLRADLLSRSLQSEEEIRSKIVSLVHNVYSFHRYGIAHGNIHALTIRINEGKTILSPIMTGNYCLDIYHDYCPPEHLLLSDHKSTMPGDIWSLACAIVEILSGQSIFFGTDPGQILQRQRSQLSVAGRQQYLTIIDQIKGDSDCGDLTAFLKSMFIENMDERPTITRIMKMMNIPIDCDGDRYIPVQPSEKSVLRSVPMLCRLTEAWSRTHVGQQAFTTVNGSAGDTSNHCYADLETIEIEIGKWLGNELIALSSRLVVCLQFGNQAFTSKPFIYPTRSLNIVHCFSMKREDIIGACHSYPLTIGLIAIMDPIHSKQLESVPVGVTRVDLRPLLTGFPVIEGYYALEPANVGQIAVKIRPMTSLDQRDFRSSGRPPSWPVFHSFLLSN